MNFRLELDALLLKHLAQSSRPRDWVRIASELYAAGHRVDDQADERFSSRDMVEDLDAQEREPHGTASLS
jgi:hypothetical protein